MCCAKVSDSLAVSIISADHLAVRIFNHNPPKHTFIYTLITTSTRCGKIDKLAMTAVTKHHNPEDSQ